MVILVYYLKPSIFLLISSTIAQKLSEFFALVPFSQLKAIIDFVYSPSELLFPKLMAIKSSENFQVGLMKGLKMTML